MAEDEDEFETCISYTRLFDMVRKVRRINDFNIPTRNGLVPQQFITFAIAFVAMVVLWFLFVEPLLSLLGNNIPIYFYVLVLFVPPAVAASRVGKPMPNGKTINGWLVSLARYHLDDPIHRRGVPIRSRRTPRSDDEARARRDAESGPRMTVLRMWEPSEEHEAYMEEATGCPGKYAPRRPTRTTAADDLFSTTTEPVDLVEWTHDKAYFFEERGKFLYDGTVVTTTRESRSRQRGLYGEVEDD